LIGDADSAAAFAQIGVVTAIPADAAAAGSIFSAALGDAANGIIIVTATVAGWLEQAILAHRIGGAGPMVIEIPDCLSGDFAGGSLMESIRQAVGISI